MKQTSTKATRSGYARSGQSSSSHAHAQQKPEPALSQKSSQPAKTKRSYFVKTQALEKEQISLNQTGAALSVAGSEAVVTEPARTRDGTADGHASQKGDLKDKEKEKKHRKKASGGPAAQSPNAGASTSAMKERKLSQTAQYTT